MPSGFIMRINLSCDKTYDDNVILQYYIFLTFILLLLLLYNI